MNSTNSGQSLIHGKSKTGGKRTINNNNGRNPKCHLASSFKHPINYVLSKQYPVKKNSVNFRNGKIDTVSNGMLFAGIIIGWATSLYFFWN